MNKHKYPEVFHKKCYQQSYFEGWYYKQVTADGKHSISFIPGASFEKTGNQGFIQCLHLNHNNELNAYNIDYDIEKFRTYEKPFLVDIDGNQFSLNKIALDLRSHDIAIEGVIQFKKLTPIKTTVIQPNIMGFFSYIPFMECNHGVLSMGHELIGSLKINGQTIDFTGGRGYLEKDWGRSFPKSYTWIQSNHFTHQATSLFCSVATIPFLIGSFEGFICNLVYKGREYRFATYNASRIIKYKQEEQNVEIILKSSKYVLYIRAHVDDSKKLLAPKRGLMNKNIKEGLGGNVKIILKDCKGNLIFKDKSSQCGVEIVKAMQDKEVGFS